MESRGNYYSAERRNRARSKGEVKTESVSARERERGETSRPRVVAFMSVVSADETCYRGVSDTEAHVSDTLNLTLPQMHTNHGYKESHYKRMFHGNQKRNEERCHFGFSAQQRKLFLKVAKHGLFNYNLILYVLKR